jgi:hypothetical protein
MSLPEASAGSSTQHPVVVGSASGSESDADSTKDLFTYSSDDSPKPKKVLFYLSLLLSACL